MIKAIDESFCTGCGLCVDACQMDVLSLRDRKAYIAYAGDCCHCMWCLFICPFDAITLSPGIPKKFDMNLRWQAISDVLVKLNSQK
ncbi:ATP-binding protein [Chloroflexota bacterium]